MMEETCYRFLPQDLELIYYLLKKTIGEPLDSQGIIREVNVYDHHPEDLLKSSTTFTDNDDGDGDDIDVVYMFTTLKKKTEKGSRIDRTVRGKFDHQGCWKGEDKGIRILGCKKSTIGWKKTFSYSSEEESCYRYIMKEFSLDKFVLNKVKYKNIVLCRIHRRRQKQNLQKKQQLRPVDDVLASMSINQDDHHEVQSADQSLQHIDNHDMIITTTTIDEAPLIEPTAAYGVAIENFIEQQMATAHTYTNTQQEQVVGDPNATFSAADSNEYDGEALVKTYMELEAELFPEGNCDFALLQPAEMIPSDHHYDSSFEATHRGISDTEVCLELAKELIPGGNGDFELLHPGEMNISSNCCYAPGTNYSVPSSEANQNPGILLDADAAALLEIDWAKCDWSEIARIAGAI